MPSGKRAKQQRRQAAAPPPVRSKGAGAGMRQASPKVLAIAGGVVVLIVIAIVLAVVLSGKSSTGTGCDGSGDGETLCLAKGTPTVGSSTGPNALPSATDIAKLLKGIHQDGFVLGDPKAPVTLIEYVDLQCPKCRDFETTELPTLIDKYVRPGKLKIKMQPWQILDATGVHDSTRGQKATIAAAKQNKAFNLSTLLYYNQGEEDTGWMNDAFISNLAASIDGLDTQQLVSDANSEATQTVITSIADYAAAHYNAQTGEMSGTPNIYLQKGDQSPHFYVSGVPDLGPLEAAIDHLLKK